MHILEALVLGIVQGISEFLPISSSGHLSIFAEFLDLNDVPILFDILLHVATLCSVLIVFRKKIGELLASLFRFITRRRAAPETPGETRDGSGTSSIVRTDEKTAADMRTILALIIATAGTGVIGLLLKDAAENLGPFFISCLFIVTGALLILSEKIKRKSPTESVSPAQAVAIGVAQGIGVLPGLSRSGVTISTALLSGVARSQAGEFSFLLSIPAIIAAFIFELKDADTLAGTVPLASLIAGMAAAFVSGLISLKFLLRLINRGKLAWFACYLIPVGIALAVYFCFR